jgi:hypothetical protein
MPRRPDAVAGSIGSSENTSRLLVARETEVIALHHSKGDEGHACAERATNASIRSSSSTRLASGSRSSRTSTPSTPPGVRQPLVHPPGLGQHRPQHGTRRNDRASPTARGRAPGAQDRARRVARGGDRRGAARGGSGRHRVADRAVLGEPRSQGQAGGAERTGAVAEADDCSEGGDATVRVLVGEGSPVELGTPATVLDIGFPDGGEVTTPSRPDTRASPPCSTARPCSAPTGDRRGLRSSSCSVRVRSSR